MTANSPFFATNSRVPSSGSTNQTASALAKPAYELGSLSSATIGQPGERARQAVAEERVRLVVGAGDRIVLALVGDLEGRRVHAHHQIARLARGGQRDVDGPSREIRHASIPTLSRARGMRASAASRRYTGPTPTSRTTSSSCATVRGPRTALVTIELEST